MSKAFKMPFSAATIAAAIFGSCLTASSASAAEWNWVNATPDRIPPDAVVGGSDYPGHEKLYICRANYQNGIHPGKVRPGFRGCNITYAGEEKTVPDFQVLVSSWVPASNGSVPPHASALGHEAGGDPLYVCRVNYQGGEHSGKVRPGLGGCFFGYAGNEVKLTDYEVLTTPAIAMATNPRLSPVYETLAVGTESGKLMWICTAEYQGGVHPGKMREDFHACNIGWGTKEIQADPQHFHVDLWGARWLSNEEIELNLGTLFEAGKQGDGVPLYICRDLLPPEARAGGSHPGKYRKDGTCFIGYAGKEYIGGGVSEIAS